VKQIHIQTDYIQLAQALKLADLAQTGGEAKVIVQEGLVEVNGEVDTRRGRKLRQGDSFSFDGVTVEVIHRGS
jgi:ribosome-associated protein